MQLKPPVQIFAQIHIDNVGLVSMLIRFKITVLVMGPIATLWKSGVNRIHVIYLMHQLIIPEAASTAKLTCHNR
jgi:hypothetical protein